MKQRIEGRVSNGNYEIVGIDGGVISQTPLSDARKDSKLKAAVKRNGWEAVPEE